jgi:VCBS repeat protein
LATGLFNNDVFMDIAVANQGARDVTVFLNSNAGLGSISQVHAPALGFSDLEPKGVAFGQFTNDGFVDIATTGFRPASPTQIPAPVYILPGDGTGGFLAPIALAQPAGYRPNDIVSADLDGNGLLDLVAVNGGTTLPPNRGGISVFLQTTLGSFTRIVGPSPSGDFEAHNIPRRCDVGDLTGDGIPDVAVANYGSDDVSVLRGDGFGNFTLVAQVVVNAEPIDVVVADFKRTATST